MRPFGLRVNCTDVASARYSRWRDTAICTALAAIGARIATTSRTTIRMPPPELPLRSLLRIRPRFIVRRAMSQTSAIRPTVTPTTTM